jgi:hypothetical protein
MHFGSAVTAAGLLLFASSDMARRVSLKGYWDGERGTGRALPGGLLEVPLVPFGVALGKFSFLFQAAAQGNCHIAEAVAQRRQVITEKGVRILSCGMFPKRERRRQELCQVLT